MYEGDTLDQLENDLKFAGNVWEHKFSTSSDFDGNQYSREISEISMRSILYRK